MKKAISEILWELIPHENKYVITEKDLLDYITNLQQENKLLKIENKEFEKRLKNQVDVSLEQSKVIEKAVKYIEPFVEFDSDIMFKGKMMSPVLDILRGEDK